MAQRGAGGGAVLVESPVIHTCLVGTQASRWAWGPTRKGHGADLGLGKLRETSICFLTQGGLVSTPEPSGPLDPPAPRLLWSRCTEPGPPCILGCGDVGLALGLGHLAWGREAGWKGQEESRALPTALLLPGCGPEAWPHHLWASGLGVIQPRTRHRDGRGSDHIPPEAPAAPELSLSQ